jgi:hypothetical protein
MDIEYMISGSIASSLQGEPRASHDIDIVVAVRAPAAAVAARLKVAFPKPDFYLDDFWLLTDEDFDRARFDRRYVEVFEGQRLIRLAAGGHDPDEALAGSHAGGQREAVSPTRSAYRKSSTAASRGISGPMGADSPGRGRARSAPAGSPTAPIVGSSLGSPEGEVQRDRNRRQAPVAGPQPRRSSEGGRCEQMDVHESDAPPHQRALLEKGERFGMGSHGCRGQSAEQIPLGRESVAPKSWNRPHSHRPC